MKDFKDQMVEITLTAKPRINGKTQHHAPGERVWESHLPRWLYESRMHTIRWITARFQYLNPDKYIKISACFYFKTGEDYKLAMRIRAQKAQVTKIKNKMSLAKEAFQPTLLVSSIEETELWQNVVVKLGEAEDKLLCLQKEQERYLAEMGK